MRYLSHPTIRRHLRVSLTVMVACLALPAITSAKATEFELAARGSDDVAGSGKPTLLITAKSASGNPGEPIPLAVTVSAKPGQSVSNTFLVGLPKGARLAAAGDAVTATDEKVAIDVTNWDLPRLSVVLSPTQVGTYTLAVVAASNSDNDGPLSFTTSTFTLKVTAEGHQAETAAGTSALWTLAPKTKHTDAADVREALPPHMAVPPSAAMPGNVAAQVGAITPKIADPVAEGVGPKIMANLLHKEQFSIATASRATATPSLGDRRVAEFRPTAAPPALAALPAIAPPTKAPFATPPALAAEVDGKALVERAERLIRLGDISGARLVLERAADRGDARATFLLAQTCDPRMLRAWKVQGLRPDPDRARALYAKAAQEGLREDRPVTEAKPFTEVKPVTEAGR